MHDQKYHGEFEKKTSRQEETIVIDLKEGVVLVAHKYRVNSNDLHPHFKSHK